MAASTVSSATRNGADALAASPHGGARIDALDFVRGVVMILMAIDHVRIYAGVPAGSPTRSNGERARNG